MPLIHDHLSDQFYNWELRGRGWQVFDGPVRPEPPFLPFFGHFVSDPQAVDDGRRPTFLSALVQKLTQSSNNSPETPESEEEPQPTPCGRESIIEIEVSVPDKLNASRDVIELFLASLSLCNEPVAMEMIGTPGSVLFQFATSESDADLVRRQLQAHFPEATCHIREATLERAWQGCDGEDAIAVEFGLAREFMLPLASTKHDPFVGIIGALAELSSGELGLFQVIFEPTRNEWAESIWRSVTDVRGSPFFVNRPELTTEAKSKISRSLFAAVVRLAVKSQNVDRTRQIARDVAA